MRHVVRDLISPRIAATAIRPGDERIAKTLTDAGVSDRTVLTSAIATPHVAVGLLQGIVRSPDVDYVTKEAALQGAFFLLTGRHRDGFRVPLSRPDGTSPGTIVVRTPVPESFKDAMESDMPILMQLRGVLED
jgi:hypothetical protein